MRLPRASGILLHPTSLPGPHGCGDLGAAAHHFVDWLVAAGQSLWQVLPLVGIGAGNSPYMSPSAFAGNVLLIDLHDLQRRGWLDEADLHAPPGGFDPHRVDYAAARAFRMPRLEKAAARFAQAASAEEREDLADFRIAQRDWLDDHALFMALAEAHPEAPDWSAWPAPLARREPAALVAARAQLAPRIAFWTFCQWRFFRQWEALRRHAHARGVRLMGDAPIFIAYHSAEVWARPGLFDLDEALRPRVVAGVPPDAFSATGQHWGNPLYRWRAHADEGYAWWIARLRHAVELVDLLRIDHFRGFAAYWEIPAAERDAVNGRWVEGPGEALFDAVARALGPIPVVAEDLGIITPDVVALRKRFALPGMRVLQFAFDSDGANPYLPHNFEHDAVVYTGTHDNDTSVGWWHALSDAQRARVRDYLGMPSPLAAADQATSDAFTHEGADPLAADAIHWQLIRAACASVADTAIHPMQDVLGLDGRARMNHPGQGEGWWEWRFDWSQVHPAHAERLAHWSRIYRRDGTPMR
jgi:4-alpha-glucanotransferase